MIGRNHVTYKLNGEFYHTHVVEIFLNLNKAWFEGERKSMDITICRAFLREWLLTDKEPDDQDNRDLIYLSGAFRKWLDYNKVQRFERVELASQEHIQIKQNE